MNANQLITMIVRLVLRKAVGRGIDAGIDRIAKSRGGSDGTAPQSRAEAQRAKRAVRMARRAGRM